MYPGGSYKGKTVDDVYRLCQAYCEELWPGFSQYIEWIDHLAMPAPLWQHQFVTNLIPQEPADACNLYFIGDSTFPALCGGIDGSASTGMRIAGRLLGREIL
jgi:hypothetical protein